MELYFVVEAERPNESVRGDIEPPLVQPHEAHDVPLRRVRHPVRRRWDQPLRLHLIGDPGQLPAGNETLQGVHVYGRRAPGNSIADLSYGWGSEVCGARPKEAHARETLTNNRGCVKAKAKAKGREGERTEVKISYL